MKLQKQLLQPECKILSKTLRSFESGKHPPLVYMDTPHQCRCAKRVTKCLVNSVSVPREPFFVCALKYNAIQNTTKYSKIHSMLLAQCQSRETLFRTSAQARKHLGSCVTQVFLLPKNDYLGFLCLFCKKMC